MPQKGLMERYDMDMGPLRRNVGNHPVVLGENRKAVGPGRQVDAGPVADACLPHRVPIGAM